MDKILTFENNIDELLYFKNLITNYIIFQYKYNSIDTHFCIDNKNT